MDARNDESASPSGRETPPSVPPSYLAEALFTLAAAIREQNEIHTRTMMVLLEQNAALIEALTEPGDEEEQAKFDMAGNRIRVSG